MNIMVYSNEVTHSHSKLLLNQKPLVTVTYSVSFLKQTVFGPRYPSIEHSNTHTDRPLEASERKQSGES